MIKGRFVGRAILPFAVVAMMGVMVFVSLADAAALRREKLTIHTGGTAHVFDIEIAETDEQQALGLMYRTTLGRRSGMLFPYSKTRVLTMWMKNTYISLDMVFIDEKGIIRRIEANTEPMSEEIISSVEPVRAVLEIAAGVAKELGLKPGDRIEQKSYFPARR